MILTKIIGPSMERSNYVHRVLSVLSNQTAFCVEAANNKATIIAVGFPNHPTSFELLDDLFMNESTSGIEKRLFNIDVKPILAKRTHEVDLQITRYLLGDSDFNDYIKLISNLQILADYLYFIDKLPPIVLSAPMFSDDFNVGVCVAINELTQPYRFIPPLQHSKKFEIFLATKNLNFTRNHQFAGMFDTHIYSLENIFSFAKTIVKMVIQPENAKRLVVQKDGQMLAARNYFLTDADVEKIGTEFIEHMQLVHAAESVLFAQPEKTGAPLLYSAVVKQPVKVFVSKSSDDFKPEDISPTTSASTSISGSSASTSPVSEILEADLNNKKPSVNKGQKKEYFDRTPKDWRKPEENFTDRDTIFQNPKALFKGSRRGPANRG